LVRSGRVGRAPTAIASQSGSDGKRHKTSDSHHLRLDPVDDDDDDDDDDNNNNNNDNNDNSNNSNNNNNNNNNNNPAPQYAGS
jgi:hypothetical protein